MHTYVKTRQNVANYAVNKMQSFVSFDMVHVFKTLRLIEMYGHVSRESSVMNWNLVKEQQEH